jgi:hypothetical protein
MSISPPEIKLLAHMTFRCPDHEKPDAKGCLGCKFLADYARESDELRKRRHNLLAELKRRLASRNVVIIDVK